MHELAPRPRERGATHRLRPGATLLVALALAATVAHAGLLPFSPTSARRVELQTVRRPGARATEFALLRVTATDVDLKAVPFDVLLPRPHPREPQASAERVELRLVRGRLDALRCSEVLFTARDVLLDVDAAVTQRPPFTAMTDPRLELTLRDGDLNGWVAQLMPDLLEPRVVFEADKLVVQAKVPVFLAAFAVTVRGVPKVVAGHQLKLEQLALDTGRLQLGEELREGLLGQVNVMLDLNTLLGSPLPVVWEQPRLAAGVCRLGGRLVPPALPAPTVPPDDPGARYRW